MAEGAHLTSAISTEKPSIFEVLAQESLVTTIRPAFKHAVRGKPEQRLMHTEKVLSEVRPEKFGWMLRNYDEIYTSLDFLLQQYYLRKYSATFAEQFYNLKRTCPSQINGKLPRGIYWKSLICVVLLPYLKQKLDQKFEELRHLYNTYVSDRSKSKLGNVFVTMYPYVHTVWEGAVLGYQLAYMFGRCEWHSPFLQLSGAVLKSDYEEPVSRASTSPPWQQLSLNQRLVFLANKVLNLTAASLSTGLSVGVFFIQFLDWWYANDSSSTSLTSLPVPDPPEPMEVGGATDFDVCPVCHRIRTNDTALSVSGYVFCYPCIYDHVSQYHMCPVTRYPAKTEHLIKLFIDKS